MLRRQSLTTIIAVVVLGVACSACGTDPGDDGDAPVLLAVGDIAGCGWDADEKTAKLVARDPKATLAVLGDAVYDAGTPQEFGDCYAPAWGAFKPRTRPAPGNHEYKSGGAGGYFAYFGPRAAGPRGWYSYGLGRWHIVVLNSQCDAVGGCEAGSPQERWLRRDLDRNDTSCTLAYFHHARFSSGLLHGNNEDMADLWRALESAGADVILSAHDHHYERFAPMTADGRVDERTGIREFVVGTGGAPLRGLGAVQAGSQARAGETYGILRLELRDDGYAWRFLRSAGRPFTDSGEARCR